MGARRRDRYRHLVPPLVRGVAARVRRSEPLAAADGGDFRPTGVLARESRAPLHGVTTRMSSLRGPWTPSTRSSSMSDVADGPDTNVIGRPSRAAGSSAAMASGTDATIWLASTTQTW